jgi:hypothetical protein
MINAVYQKIFAYLAQFPDVWFASHGEIASWVIKNKFASNPLPPAQGLRRPAPETGTNGICRNGLAVIVAGGKTPSDHRSSR